MGAPEDFSIVRWRHRCTPIGAAGELSAGHSWRVIGDASTIRFQHGAGIDISSTAGSALAASWHHGRSGAGGQNMPSRFAALAHGCQGRRNVAA